jgi:DNA invertase Pin-like site-specific DNA recombinase
MRATIYARFSSELQKATSIEDQVRVARAYAAEQGWTLDESRIYSDAGISGSSIDGRPGLQALMAAAAQQPRPFDVLLVDDSSRIARDLADAIRTMQMLRFFGVRVIYISQHIDSANDQAETLIAVHGLVDGLYLQEATKKIRRGLAGQHARGFATGSITFGYRTVPVPDPSGKVDADGRPTLLGKRVEIHPEEAATVVQIFQWYAASVGVETITARLNREGHPGPRGQRWRAGAVRRILKNEKFRGLLIWGQRTFDRRPGTRQKVQRPLPRDQWHVQERPELRIVSDELWQQCRQRAAEVRQAFDLKPGQSLVRGRNAALHSRHLFSGFMRCGICGGAITSVSGGGGSPRYGCSRSWRDGSDVCRNRLTVRAKVADPALLAGLRAELLRPETVEYVTRALAVQLNQVIDQRPALRSRAEDALRDAKRRLDNLVAAIEGGATAASLLEALHTRENDARRLQAELDALSEPLEQKLRVMPTWVRQQLEDAAGLLSAASERSKTEFRRLGVSFVLHMAQDGAGLPFLRAEGTTDFARVLSSGPLSTTDALHPGSAPETAPARPV